MRLEQKKRKRGRQIISQKCVRDVILAEECLKLEVAKGVGGGIFLIQLDLIENLRLILLTAIFLSKKLENFSLEIDCFYDIC